MMADRRRIDLLLPVSSAILIITCFAVPFLVCFGPALFRDRQFAYRDSAHYYYPLHQRVQKEWNEGRWPLWEPEENAGTPLLGDPTAAVLYPGKLVFAMFPYAWGARVYIVAHTVLAFVTMLVMLRSWQASWIGSSLGGLAYAYGAPILFQYCNVIYLVGAAWLPLGMHAVDRWVRLGRRWALLELALVLAMQTLGGDPQSSYLLGLASVGYAATVAWHRRSTAAAIGTGGSLRHRVHWTIPLAAAALLISWFVATVILAQWLPAFRPPGYNMPLPWMTWVPRLVFMAWTLVAVGLLAYWVRRGRDFRLAIATAGLAFAAILAVAVSAAQLLPVIEFIQRTWRVTDMPLEASWYSLEPFRAVELLWPNILGTRLGENSYWIEALGLPGTRAREWVPSLYVGGLTVMLASTSVALWRGTLVQIWLTSIVIVSLVIGLGDYSSPIWATRFLARATRSPVIQKLGRAHWGHSIRPGLLPIRGDGLLRDGDGSVYWWLNTTLPGMRQFRFPSKFLTFSTLGLAGLAALGWDRLVSGRSRGLVLLLSLLAVVNLLFLTGVWWQRHAIVTAFRTSTTTSAFGPFNAKSGFAAIERALFQSTIVVSVGLAVVKLVRTHARLAGACVLVVAAVDLTVANARYVLTVPQAVMDERPAALKVIDAAERANPTSGPFRVHRMARWGPLGWEKNAEPHRNTDLVKWNRNTLAPKQGINLGIAFTYALGAANLVDYQWLFTGFATTVRDLETARTLQHRIGHRFYYYPRRSFDLWNTRYFIVPFDPGLGQNSLRATEAFLFKSDIVYPDPAAMRGPENAKARRQWSENADFQILRNPHALPAHGSCTPPEPSQLSPGVFKRTVRSFWMRWPTAAISGAKMGLRSSIRSPLPGWTATRS